MDVNALSAITTSGQTNKASGTTIAGNFDTFLSLLTTQLKNQNPLEPLDTNEFTAQLVQFSGVEQSIQTNKTLEQLVALQSASALTSVVGYIGKTVSANAAESQLKNGQAQWTLNAGAASQEATINIRNSAGKVVVSTTTILEQGENTWNWNGQGVDGSQFPDGLYTIDVKAKDAGGNNVAIDTQVTGLVTAIDMTGAEPVLTVGSNKVKLSAVKIIGTPGI